MIEYAIPALRIVLALIVTGLFAVFLYRQVKYIRGIMAELTMEVFRL
jgi:hypothetical protein